MSHLLGVLGVAAVVFATTNTDDLFLLAAFFSAPHLRARAVVLGQFLGITLLVVASAAAAWASVAVGAGYTALLGAAPLALGLRKLWELRRGDDDGDSDARHARTAEGRAERRTHSQAL